MCVIRFHETGGPAVLGMKEELPATPGPGEVVMKVEATGLDRAEAAFCAGEYLEQPEFPPRLGYEANGIVAALGLPMSRHGVYGDWALVTAAALIPCSSNMSAIEGASVWMAYLTAYVAIWSRISRLARV
jgi:NADPH:quinone reductase-like Zn-dependent oxidoreductase